MVKLNETCRILKVVMLFFTKFIAFKQENDKKLKYIYMKLCPTGCNHESSVEQIKILHCDLIFPYVCICSGENVFSLK